MTVFSVSPQWKKLCNDTNLTTTTCEYGTASNRWEGGLSTTYMVLEPSVIANIVKTLFVTYIEGGGFTDLSPTFPFCHTSWQQSSHAKVFSLFSRDTREFSWTVTIFDVCLTKVILYSIWRVAPVLVILKSKGNLEEIPSTDQPLSKLDTVGKLL